MLTIVIEAEELFDEAKEEFITSEGFTLELEHSLVSLSKWESKFEKPFLSKDHKTPEEFEAYFEAMILSPEYPPNLLRRLSAENIDRIHAYIESKQTATTFGNMPEHKGKAEVITSELIYYWMIAFNIPFECERWHLNRLFSLIRVCNVKNTKPKKLSRNEIAKNYREMNAKRRAELGTKG